MAALRIHQDGIDDVRIALPLPPLAFWAPRQIRRIAALQHHALDGFGIFAGAGAGRIFPSRFQRVPMVEGNRRRQVDPRIVEFCHKSLEPLAALGKRQRAQIGVALAKQIISAKVDRVILCQFRRDQFAVQSLLKNVKTLHPAVAHHQQFAIDGAGQVQRRQQVRKAVGDVLAAARIEPCLHVAARVAAAHRLHANAVPFPFRDEIRGVEIGKVVILDGVRQHHRAEGRGVEIDRLFRTPLEPREQLEIGRGESRPHQFEFVRVLVPEFCGRGFCQPRRDPDPHRAGDEF